MILILIPIYNGIEFLDECLNSVNNQTFEDWICLIGINGHNKNSIQYNITINYINKLDDKLKKKYIVLDLYDLTEKGKSIALNKMIEYNRIYLNKRWISILDVDDKWTNNKLEEQIKYINDYDVIGTKCQYFGDRNDIPFIPCGDLINFNFKEVNPIINSSSLIKEELCYWLNNGIEDYDLWLKLKSRNYKFYNIDKILCYHRIHNQSYFNSKGNHLKVEDLLKKY